MRSLCPTVAFVPHREVEGYLRLGWMMIASLGEYHGQFSILMGWRCECPCTIPRASHMFTALRR